MSPTEYKATREHLGTQAEVAAMLGVNRVTVAKRENGTMTITNEAVLAIQSLRRPRRKRKSENRNPPASAFGGKSTQTEQNKMQATLKFPSRAMAQQFATTWAFYSRRGYNLGAAQKDGSASFTLFNVTENDKEWIDSAVQSLNSCLQSTNT